MEQNFKFHLQSLGLAEMTIRVYLHAVRKFFSLYHEVKYEDLNAFRSYLLGHYKAQTANLYIIGMNKYLTFIGMARWKLRVVKLQQRSYLDNVISNAQYLRLKENLKRDESGKWYHVVWTLAATGVRVSELLKFKVEHVGTGFLDICSKGNKQRRIYIPPQLQTSLQEWCQREGRLDGYLFVNRNGSPISTRGIAKGLEHAARSYAIDVRLVHPHAFRHLFAKNFLSQSNDLSLLADLLGHGSLETTKIYLRYSMQEQREKVESVVTW